MCLQLWSELLSYLIWNKPEAETDAVTWSDLHRMKMTIRGNVTILTQVETELRVLQVTPYKVPQSINWSWDKQRHRLPAEAQTGLCAATLVSVWTVIHLSEGISLQFVVLLVVVLLSSWGASHRWNYRPVSFFQSLSLWCGYSRKCGEGAASSFHIAAIPVASQLKWTLSILHAHTHGGTHKHTPVSRGLKKPCRTYLSGNWTLRTTWRGRVGYL